jgi:hypothetical protein
VKDFKFNNVLHDGTCGYRVVAHHLLGNAEQWHVIVEDSFKWLESNAVSLTRAQQDHIIALKETYDNFTIKSKLFKGFCSNTWMSQDFLCLLASLENIVFLVLKPNQSKRTEYELIWVCGDLNQDSKYACVESKGVYFLQYSNDKWDALTPKPESFDKIVRLSKEMISSFSAMSLELERSMESETAAEDDSAMSSLVSESPELSSEELSARMWQPPKEADVSPPPSSSSVDSECEDNDTAASPVLPAVLEDSSACSSPAASRNTAHNKSSSVSPEVISSTASSNFTPDTLIEKLAAAEEKLSKFAAPKSQKLWKIDSLHNCTAPSTFLQVCDRVVNLNFVDTALRPIKDTTHRYYTASYVQKRSLYNVWQYYAKSAPAQFKSWAICTILFPVNCENPPRTWEEYSQRFPETPHPLILGGLWGTNCGNEVIVVGNLQGKF